MLTDIYKNVVGGNDYTWQLYLYQGDTLIGQITGVESLGSWRKYYAELFDKIPPLTDKIFKHKE